MSSISNYEAHQNVTSFGFADILFELSFFIVAVTTLARRIEKRARQCGNIFLGNGVRSYEYYCQRLLKFCEFVMRKIYRFSRAGVFCLLSGAVAALGGCAYSDAAAVIDGDERGFVYPICEPFLTVSGANASLLMVPNPNRLRAARFGTFLAKNSIDVDFAVCGPTKIKSDMDSTTVAVELFNTLQTAIERTGALPFGAVGTDGPTGKTFQVFSFEFDNAGNFQGLQPLISPEALLYVDITPVRIQAAPETQDRGKGGGSAGERNLESPLNK